MTGSRYEVQPIGTVESTLIDRATAPRQGDEGSPDAFLVFDPRVAEGIRDLRAGTEVILLTWLDRARREALDGTPIVDIKPLLGPIDER